ncbi:MAG: hypothetical protein JSW53_00885 [Candidatus Bathyarchaeota archaeon]|nr:MAG: hypothetical protein JSW53_00885 [Candidatus Bathyarchaeota archaeon]
MIEKAVLPAAGLGTRLLPITKELPKEMLPLFFRREDDTVCLKPMLQAVFEQLYGVGFRRFCIIVGRGKRAIEDHFTPDWDFVQHLKSQNRASLTDELREFYRKVEDSNMVFISQPTPRGFGDAVYRGNPFTGEDPFLLHAGDDLVLSRKNSHLERMIDAFKRYDADATFLVEELEDPRRYGVAVGEEVAADVIEVEKVIEKPEKPPSNLAIIALYIFKPTIYEAIKAVTPDENGEVQLGDALQALSKSGGRLYALKLRSDERRIDIGTPESYSQILKETIGHV